MPTLRTDIVRLLAVAIVAAGTVIAVPAAAQTRIIMSNDNNALGLKGQTFERLKKEIAHRLGNKVSVDLSHSGTLFDQNTQIQGLQLGSVDIIAPTSGIFATVAPKVDALILPFLLSTPEQIDKALKDPVVRKVFVPALEKKNIEPIAIWINGPRDFSYRGSKAILTPDDMRGVKIRVQAIPSDIATMNAVGANVVSMSWSEVPTALQQGIIDAVEPTPNALVGAGLPEMIDQMTRINYHYSFYIVAANRQWWDGLPKDVRSGLQAALDAATKWNWSNAEKENDASYAAVANLGKKINKISPAQRKLWVKAVQPVWRKFGVELVGSQVMHRLEQIGGVLQ